MATDAELLKRLGEAIWAGAGEETKKFQADLLARPKTSPKQPIVVTDKKTREALTRLGFEFAGNDLLGF